MLWRPPRGWRWGCFAPLGRLLGDPRRRAVGRFLDLRNVFPQRYPLEGALRDDVIAAERPLARALDYGVIGSRLTELYAFAAGCLDEPRLATLVRDGTPCYSWPAEERAPWLGGTTWPPARAIALATAEGPLGHNIRGWIDSIPVIEWPGFPRTASTQSTLLASVVQRKHGLPMRTSQSHLECCWKPSMKR